MGMIFNSVEELFEEIERERAARPWYIKLYHKAINVLYYTPAYRISERYHRYKNMYQRIHNGYGYQDMWDIGVYSAEVIARACEEYAKKGYTYPGEEKGFTQRSWYEFLLDIAYDIYTYTHLYRNYDDLLRPYYHLPWEEKSLIYDEINADMDERKIRAQLAMQRFSLFFEYMGD